MTGRHYTIDGELVIAKPCATCGEVKPIKDYHRSARSKDGHQSRCKICACAARNESYARHLAAQGKERRVRTMVERTCDHCQTAFLARIGEVNRGAGRFCKPACWHGYYSQQRLLANKRVPKSVYEHRRNARKRNAFVADVNPDDIYRRDRGMCGLCGKMVKRADRSMDHIVPLAAGGTHEPKNVQLAHIVCNSRKKAKIIGQTRMFG